MKKNWTVEELCSLVGGELTGNGRAAFSELAYDSRILSEERDILFIALRGRNHDGHRYIPELYDRGLRAFLVSVVPEENSCPEAGFCRVDEPLAALQMLAAEKRRRFRGQVAAITGSNGKTIVKEWIYQLMSPDFRIHRSPMSFNSQLGVPLSVWMAGPGYDMALFEAGISRPGEMEKIERIIRPDVGLFTSLGPAHQENFHSLNEKLREKMILFRDCQKIIFRSDQSAGPVRPVDEAGELAGRVVTWSTGPAADYVYALERKESHRTSVTLGKPEGHISTLLPFTDEASIENALHSLTFAMEMGLPADKAMERAAGLEPVSMRMEILRGINGSILVNDSYNSDVAGIAAALDLLDQQKQHRQKAVILSDLLETGRDETELYGEIARLIGQREVSLFTGIGPAMMRNRDLFTGNSIFFEDTDGFIKRMDRTRLAGASVLIKGSRKFGFERITSELQLQTHQTRLEIDLNAMVGNLNYFRSLLGDGVKVMVMVKALSYGSGSVEIASLLQFHKVDYLAVAFIDEGIELRKAGIHMPIMVMNPDPAGYGPMVDYRLEPEIYSYRGLDALEKLLRYREVSKYPIHLKIDTGMHRLGFSMSDVEHLAGRAGAGPFRVTSIFSHLAASDEEEQDAFTHHQIEIFERACKQFADLLGHRPDRHILNSSGIERFPEARFEMVRLGIGLHGIGRGESLTPVSTYRTAISQIREVEAGETVGYSRSGKILRKTRVATLPVGYADGLDRRLGNGKGHVWLKDHLAPVLGNICMDMTMIDVTGIPAEEGDSVEIFGKQLPVTELARIAGTIPYEILTSVPERVKRIYLQE